MTVFPQYCNINYIIVSAWDYYWTVIKMPSISHCKVTPQYHRITVSPGYHSHVIQHTNK